MCNDLFWSNVNEKLVALPSYYGGCSPGKWSWILTLLHKVKTPAASKKWREIGTHSGSLSVDVLKVIFLRCVGIERGLLGY